MPTLVLTRDEDLWGQARRIAVSVDGRRVARLRVGGRADVEVAPGTHFVRARMDVWRSPLLVVTVADDTVTVAASLPTGVWWQLLLTPARALALRQTD